MSNREIIKIAAEQLEVINQTLKCELKYSVVEARNLERHWAENAIHNIEEAIDHLGTAMQE